MKFFTSSQSEQKEKKEEKQASSSEIPAEVLGAVRIMGDQPKDTPTLSPRDEERASTPQAASPFLGGDVSQPGAVQQASAVTPNSTFVPGSPSFQPELKPLFENKAERNRSVNMNKTLIFGILGIAVLAIALGVWWYSTKSSPAVETPPLPSPASSDAAINVGMDEPAAPVEPPFSLDTPNYLSIDIETITSAGLREAFKQPSDKILTFGLDRPVEFLLTDKNNNPIAFSRFAYLMNIELDPELLSAIGESFSLFLYNDQGRVVFGLGLMLPSEAALGLVSPQEDGSFPYAFRGLFFEGLTVPKEAAFRSGVYETQSVRFVNIDAAQNVSFDYAVRGNDWYIGTSKDTLRAILDK